MQDVLLYIVFNRVIWFNVHFCRTKYLASIWQIPCCYIAGLTIFLYTSQLICLVSIETSTSTQPPPCHTHNTHTHTTHTRTHTHTHTNRHEWLQNTTRSTPATMHLLHLPPTVDHKPAHRPIDKAEAGFTVTLWCVCVCLCVCVCVCVCERER